MKKSVLVYALHSLENVLGLARFRVFVPNMYVSPQVTILGSYRLKQLNENYIEQRLQG